MKRVLNSTEAAWLLQIDARDLPAVMRKARVRPLGRVRIGRSYVTRWAVEDVLTVAGPPAALTSA